MSGIKLLEKGFTVPEDKSSANVLIEDIQFRKLIENSQEGLALLNKNLEVIYRSNSAERINGWNSVDRAKYNMDDLIHPNDIKTVKKVLNDVLNNPGISKTIDYRAKHFNGHYIWLECIYTNHLNDPDINAIVCNFRDISEKIRADELLHHTIKELYAYKYALDESSIVAITDQKGIINHVNKNFCRISKYSEAELIGQDHRIINSGYHDKAFIRNIWTTIAKGEIWKGELKNKAKDGSYYWVDTTIVPFLNEQGKPYQYVAVRSDITERKLSEEKILENERFIKTITDNMPAMIAYWSADLHCLFANKPYMDWFRKKPQQMQVINKRDLLGKKEFKLHELHIKNVLTGKPQSFERVFYKKNKQPIFTHTQYLPDVQGNIIKGFYSLIYDVTEIKLAEIEVKKKNEQIRDILDNITDGFIALDKNMCYTYANKQVGVMLGRDPNTLLGKNVWELFPEAIDTPTYEAMQTALVEKRMICNEDYSPSINLWQENRVYPSGNGISMFIRDITKSKQEEHRLKLLESVITNTTDAVLITEADHFNESNMPIVYVNEAFEKMTGYSAEEIIGKTPRILQGPRSDKAELKRLYESLQKKEPCEITIINYKKDGEEFWINFSVSPVNNDRGECTHFIAVERDITERKNEELQKALLSEISLIFNETGELNDALHKVLQVLVNFDNFSIAEAWLIGADKSKINLVAKFSHTTELENFYVESNRIKSFKKGKGLPGITWETETIQFWENIDKHKLFLRRKAAKKVGLKTMYGLPLKHNNEIIGALLLGSDKEKKQNNVFISLFEKFSSGFGAEIKRKQLEQELNQIFNLAPDTICITGSDGYLKKINPAMQTLLEYSENELLNIPLAQLIHPDDLEKSTEELKYLSLGKPTSYFENRLITKSGKIRWLAWTTTSTPEDGLFLSIVKDITYKKELEKLLEKATNLARIGGWEIDMVKETIYWSEVTRNIVEVDIDYQPDINLAFDFYKEGENRATIIKLIEDAIINGNSGDAELEIITAKGNPKWIRVIVEAEFADGKCLRLYGSFQDINERKKAEIASKQSLEERNIILESIDDAFFAVDKNWVVTYWNSMAEKVLQTPKNKILGHNLWDVFSDSINSESYKKYHHALETEQAVHFEDYYKGLEKWYEISAYPSDTGLSVYFKDITDRRISDIRLKELNQSLQKHAKELAISNAELEQFAYVASHDLQEPLRMVTSFMTQLEKKYGDVVDDKGRQYIHFAVDGAKRMRQIILDLLDFSRVGRTEDDLEEIDFNTLINEIIALYRRQIEEEKAEIIFENMPTIQTYKTPIRQVFQNLISNSLKYHTTDKPVVINISCKKTKTHFQFSIKDNGIGISPEYFDKIFIIFQRLHNKDEYSGTGMGLAISKKIIENLGGKIWVRSAEGKGSTFYFTLLKPNQK